MENMFLENESKYNFDETLEHLTTEIKAASWGLKHTHDLQGMLKEKGYDVNSARVLEICKPIFANELLNDDSLKIYSNMMPCRISVYKKEDGKTYISRMNIEAFSAMIGGKVGEVMQNAYRDVETFLIKVIST
jgi:uncharacterized protein (DUF302 family)